MVWPSYTSIVGKLKYQKRYALSIHQAAAMVIGRRGLGLKEKLTKQLFDKAVNAKIIKNKPNKSKKLYSKQRTVKWPVWSKLNKKLKKTKKTKPKSHIRSP